MFGTALRQFKQDKIYLVIFIFLTIAVLCTAAAKFLLVKQESASYEDFLVVDSPQVGAKISNPVVITGEARGQWFFEAGFPVLVLDEDKLIIGEGFATAAESWMTEDFVPFSARVEFVPTTKDGYVRLVKSNASGLPENDDSFDIPVQFTIN